VLRLPRVLPRLGLEYERIELIKLNLFDNNGTYKDYVLGRNGVGGPALKIWKEMRLPAANTDYARVMVILVP
jgi:hypothetical protein